MSHREEPYEVLRFLQSPSDSQRRSNPDGTPRFGTGEKEFSVPWHLIVVTLGMFCLILLMTLIVLVIQNIHHIQEKHEQAEIIANLTHKYRHEGTT
ncbi:killer cell lectin-like receptor 2 [Ochotona curzoniae]|uniref:killer cell lectin-like receptor 2 n=1 Tax=Ochotona curzoniae TaxID=130825 RepID=UPI001B34DB83|nr:killer cell lectin-like receptor 2 [Ochotona curzoniae]